MGHGAADFAILLFSLDGFALVVTFLAAGDAQLDLGAAILEIDGQGNERGAALEGFGFEAPQLPFVNQQLLLAKGFVADGGLLVRVDMATVKDQLAVFDAGVGFGELASAQAKGFDFAAEQDQAAFQLGRDEILMERAAIGDARGEVMNRPVLHVGGVSLA